jgi:subtilisin
VDRVPGVGPLARPGDAGPLEDATGRGVRVAVVDSGWDRGWADPRVLAGLCLLSGADAAPGEVDGDGIGHGTACADLLLRVAPEAEILPVRVFGDRLTTSPAVLAAAIRRAVDAGAAVLSLSLGTRGTAGVRTLYAACEYARRRGAVVVAANARHGFSSPAIFENTLGVGLLRGNNAFRLEYRAGDAVECLANGVHSGVRWLHGERRLVQGTSFAAPVVAGLVARLRERDPAAGLDDVRRWLSAEEAPACPRSASLSAPPRPVPELDGTRGDVRVA